MIKKIEPLLTTAELSKLSFITSTNILIKGEGSAEIVHRLSGVTEKEKIEALLSGRASVSSLSKGMKAFITPGSSLKTDDLKEVCKQKDLTITLNPKKADVVIGNANTIGRAGSSGKIARRSYIYQEYFDSCASYKNPDFVDYCRVRWSTDISDTNTNVMFGPGTFQYNYPTFPVTSNQYYDSVISNECAQVLYNILSKGIPVVNDIDLFKSIDKVPLDSFSYETLCSMFDSSSSEDWAIAMQIIYNCDLDKSDFYIWELIQSYSYKMDHKKFRNTKMHDIFNGIVRELRYLDHEEIMIHLAEKLQLTKGIWDELIEYIIADNKRNCPNPSISAITIEVKMTQTYEEFIDQYVSKVEEHDD